MTLSLESIYERLDAIEEILADGIDKGTVAKATEKYNELLESPYLIDDGKRVVLGYGETIYWLNKYVDEQK